MEYPIIADFGIDPYYIMQVISLLSRDKPSCKRSAIMDLTKNDIEKNWAAAISGLNAGLELLQQQCGVLAPGYLPYNTILIPLAAILARTDDIHGPALGVVKDKICQWFWCSVFGQRYESSPNSQSAVDFLEVTRWIKKDSPPEAVAKFKFDPAILLETSARQRAVYRGTICLMLRRGTRDFYSNEPLSLEVIRKNNVDDHHIFPNAYLERKGVEKKLRDCVLNHTLIDRVTNQSISDRSPQSYLADIRKEWQAHRGEDKFKELLDSHLLPLRPRIPVMDGRFRCLPHWRQDILWQEMQKVTEFTRPIIMTKYGAMNDLP